MIFSSPRFLAFLLVLLALLGLRTSLRWRQLILGAASCLFYAAWDVRYLALLLGVSVVDYYAATQIHRATRENVRRGFLAASIISNLGLLAYFKYTNFLIGNFNVLFGSLGLYVEAAHILLPAGISFYTFKTMSYTIDVYRREIPPCRSWLSYATFVTFFPELIAGPIVRASVFLPQMDRDIGPTRGRLSLGTSIFLLGLVKKLVIADPIAAAIDPIFADVGAYGAPSLWIAVVGYTVQIYCDFSGYSDMAIGVAKMIGYDLPENFTMPYISTSITEFWRRWHITLSSWLRDYLYIPLGGNRLSSLRTYINLATTMLLGGLWHGASWNFVAWGALHGTALAGHRLLRSRPWWRPLPAVVAGPMTLLFVSLAWIPFRAATFGTTWLMLRRMFTWQSGLSWIPTSVLVGVGAMVLGHGVGRILERSRGPDAPAERALALIDARVHRDPISSWFIELRFRRITSIYVAVVVMFLVFFFAATGTSPFIYFQF